MKINNFNTENRAERIAASYIERGRLPHGIIFEGGTGEEREKIALNIAAALLCENENEKPCGICRHCEKIFAGCHPDVMYFGPTKKEGQKTLQFNGGTVREIAKRCTVLPNEAKGIVIIMRDLHLMREDAQNAFLKLLEEPPPFAHFIMLTENRSNLLETIISRAPYYAIGEVKAEIYKEIPKEEAVAAAKRVCGAFAERSMVKIVAAAGVFDKNRPLMEAAFPVMQEIIVLALKENYLPGGESGQCEEEKLNKDYDFYEIAHRLKESLSPEGLMAAYDGLNRLMESVYTNANANLTGARLCTLLCSIKA